jgi:hypothetical protein
MTPRFHRTAAVGALARACNIISVNAVSFGQSVPVEALSPDVTIRHVGNERDQSARCAATYHRRRSSADLPGASPAFGLLVANASVLTKALLPRQP